MQKMNLDPYLAPYTKINLKYSRILPFAQIYVLINRKVYVKNQGLAKAEWLIRAKRDDLNEMIGSRYDMPVSSKNLSSRYTEIIFSFTIFCLEY